MEEEIIGQLIFTMANIKAKGDIWSKKILTLRMAMRMKIDKNYYRESEGDFYYKENGSFKIEKKRNGYIMIGSGRIIIKEGKE